MPLSTVCVSTINSRPRTWSSYTNIRAKDVQGLGTMNSAEEISKYKEPDDHYYSPTLSRRLLGYGYELPDKLPKKEKKWSLGSLFRRKKKDDSGESSSEDDLQKRSGGFLRNKKKKTEKKRQKNKSIGTFDHVVISQNTHLYSNGNHEREILSDSAGFNNYVRRTLPNVPPDTNKQSIFVQNSRESLDEINKSNSVISLGSNSDSLTKKNRKDLAKFRAEARRFQNLKRDSSSDEESQRSASSASRFRSDESLFLSREHSSAGNRRSRAARTERYLRRHSKDGENPHCRITKSDIDNAGMHLKLSDDSNRSLSRSPLIPNKQKLDNNKNSYSSLSSQSPSISGLSTIPPPSHGSHSKLRVNNCNPPYKPPTSMNDYNYNLRKYDNFFNNQRSISCEANIHKTQSSDQLESEIYHVQFPIVKPNIRQRNLSLINTNDVNFASRQPPPPPPRDPKRLITTQTFNENSGRPNTYYFDNSNRSKSFHTQNTQNLPLKKLNSFNLHTNGRSTSEDQLIHHSLSNIQVQPRPSSATPESNKKLNYTNRIDLKLNQENYSYLMDKKPRSRRPIFIQTNDHQNNSNNVNTNNNNNVQTDIKSTQTALDFWKQKDKEQINAKKSNSPQMFTCQTQVQTQIFLPSVIQTDLNSTDNVEQNENDEELKRKSANLEEALDELEAIYNSLKLGDEDLLERAEQREKESVNHSISPLWGPSRGALSDSSFSYEPFDTINSSGRHKRLSRKSQTIDRRNDDMAFRKLNKERANTINNPQSVVNTVSYLEASPVYGKDIDDNQCNNRNPKEPDITLDDVVYRNVKYANSTPKVVEPQPPFGIPLGPITLASNSDYLHAIPDDIPRPSFKPRKIPDLVKDDLAYRNLRKDPTKDPVLPPLSGEDLKNNNSKLDLNSLKKKRAVRSLSANIGSLINKDVLARGLEKYKQENNNSETEFKSLTDIADAMEIARQVLREKENKINNTRKAFLSDTDTNVELSNSSFGKLTERRLNFLNSLKTPSIPDDNNYINSKPPRGLTPERRAARSPKESTPVPISPLEQLTQDEEYETIHKSFDDMLTVLATEARETSERITKELQDFDEKSTMNQKEKLNVDEKLNVIDSVSEQAKLCEKLLESVVDSTDLMTPVEEVEHLTPSCFESVANVVVTRADQTDKSKKSEVDSDHDYENLVSDKELTIDEVIEDDKVNKCISPFEEHRAELIASFQELKKNIDMDISELQKSKERNRENCEGNSKKSEVDENDKNGVDSNTGKHTDKRSRSRLPRWLRPRSCGSLSDPTTMSEGQQNRAERIARYKEERRKQLAAQFASISSDPTNKKLSKDSSSSEGPRPTRTSRLRAAATCNQENASSPIQANSLDCKEKQMSVGTTSSPNRCTERDKSHKRKSNLNRSLNCEEVPNLDNDNVKNRRRRRRLFPQEILEKNLKSSNDDNSKSDIATSSTATSLPQSSNCSTSQTQVSSIISSNRTTPTRKSELSIHMENARRGIIPPYSEVGKFKSPSTTRTTVVSSSNLKDRSPKLSSSSDTNERDYRSSTPKRDVVKRTSKLSTKTQNVLAENPVVQANRNIAKKMEELTALTRETLARVEKLASKRESPRVLKTVVSTSTSTSSIPKDNSTEGTKKSNLPSSILKKKSTEDISPQIVEVQVPNHLPVSILKRKVSQDEQGISSTSTHTPPVTFSPSVIEPTPTNRKQGILKKRRSLDESQVMRHRSCSPDVVSKNFDSRSILKNQRRSSLEELRHTANSPELHGILKRKSLKTEDSESLNSPQSILKRKSGASSAGSTNSTPHVSITTAVILAAAGGAEMVLDSPPESVKPILKKKSFSEENTITDNSSDLPKPILKKKSSTDTDDCDEKPKKPILKISRSSLEETYCKNISSDVDSDCKPILRQNSNAGNDNSRPRLSFCSDNITNQDLTVKRLQRRSHTISSEFNLSSTSNFERSEDRDLIKPRPLSVSELVMNFEVPASTTGAIPKRTNANRHSDRYKTQPVTSNELEASLNFVERSNFEEKNYSVDADLSDNFLNFTTSLEHDSNLNSFLTSSLQNISPDSGVKMSSDSAFQSLGDGLELDQDDKSPESSLKHQPTQLELNMKNLAEEAKKFKLKMNSGGLKNKTRRTTDGDNTRFSTQPITLDEVEEAIKIKHGDQIEDFDDVDPSKLSIFERIQLFNERINHSRTTKTNTKPRTSRCRTLPITSDEVECAARFKPVESKALDDSGSSSQDKHGILKSKLTTSNIKPPKSVLKTNSEISCDKSPSKSEVVLDEGISCNDSGSDTENMNVSNLSSTKEIDEQSSCANLPKLKSSDDTSDGESSGGREVRSIFRNENKLKVKQALEATLSKSKSYVKIGGDATESTNKKNTNIRRSQTQSAMPRTIAELQAKLQQNGESGWKKRVPQNNNANDELKLLKDKNKYNDELSEKSILALKKDELDAASKQWKNRVEKSDAEKFSVVGRMEKDKDGKLEDLPINIPNIEKEKRTPQAKRFKGKDGSNNSLSTPVSPDKNKHIELNRSSSLPEKQECNISLIDKTVIKSSKTVSIIQPDDETFKNFYKGIEGKQISNETALELSVDDLDAVTRQSLLVQKKNIKLQKRRGASRNPIKALACRTDIANEYTEIVTGVAEREKKRLNIEKLAKNSNLAIEALAGLASKEDFTTVPLKKPTSSTTFVPFKKVMLLQVKGRRHVQIRLVEPAASSINEGDNYILVTSNSLYNYVGAYANVIEQSRALDICNHILQTGDLGCKTNEIITVTAQNSDSTSKSIQNFWKLLGCQGCEKLTNAGNPNEDEIFESNILATNMIYKLEDNELVPLENYWGTSPKVEMLEATSVIVFDFGTEMYVWCGKNAPLEKKKRAMVLAKELWDEGYNYQDCNISPIDIASILGDRSVIRTSLKKDTSRPDWALFTKLTQHRETVLFREKFLDWPDYSRVIKVRGDELDIKNTDIICNIQPCNVDEMLKKTFSPPDLVIEGIHLGRGDQYFDEETKRLFEFETLNIKMWRILENNSEKLCDKSIGHFYDGDSYIIRWNYRSNCKGRELSGKPSKFTQAGRDRVIYFCWQGKNSSINEKGYAALLTVELDNESAPQIRIEHGYEPPAFLSIFNGTMVVHSGKRDDPIKNKKKLFMVKGDIEKELCLVEVPCCSEEFRSRTCFILIDSNKGEIIIWNGAKANSHTRQLAKLAANTVAKTKAVEFSISNFEKIDITSIEEGEKNEQFLKAVGNNMENYYSLLNDDKDYNFTMRLFYLSSICGNFEATEILSPYRSQHSSPYPFLQTELYSASQPALFLIDNHHELWLWQGWWPETEENVELSDQTGSGAVRWQAERKAAMQTCVEYWRHSHGGDEAIPAYLIWAGLEPLEFKNLFPNWIDRNDVAELNLKEGKQKYNKLPIEKELAHLSRTTYSLAELLQRPLPEGVDPSHLENYLCSEDFVEALGTSKEEFQQLPAWKQSAIKKEKGLF